MSKKKEMEDLENNNGEEIRHFIESLSKPQLVDLLSQLGSKYPSIAEDIASFANVDRARRKLNAFQLHGEIEVGNAMLDRDTGKSVQNAFSAPNKFFDGVYTLSDEAKRIRSAPDLAERNLLIGNLSQEVTREMLYNYFERHGDILECILMCIRRKGAKVSSLSGIVTYKTAEAAKKAIDDLDQTTFGGRTITVKYFGRPSVPARVAPMEALHKTPEYVEGYTYSRPAAPYAAPPYPYPRTGAPFAAPRYPYPQTGAPFAVSPYPYPRTDAPHAAPPFPYPRTSAPHALPPYPYPQTDVPYAASPYP